jgi:preprotein translocase subunit YajC
MKNAATPTTIAAADLRDGDRIVTASGTFGPAIIITTKTRSTVIASTWNGARRTMAATERVQVRPRHMRAARRRLA